ncbi:MAG: hypothetical protein L0Z50_09250 [Verrucomicrobiales bacterium]|nr:hypothetical protein [Verrucomicrobiales bacterium]
MLLRKGLWSAFVLLMTALALWIVAGPWSPADNVSIAAVLLFFVAQPLGAAWMIYQCIRHEERPFAYLVVLFFPYAWVWYYFERYRRRTVLAHRLQNEIAGKG